MFLFVVRTSHLERKHIFLGCFLCVCTHVSKNKKKKTKHKNSPLLTLVLKFLL